MYRTRRFCCKISAFLLVLALLIPTVQACNTPGPGNPGTPRPNTQAQNPAIEQIDSPFDLGHVNIMLARPNGVPYYYYETANARGKKVEFDLKIYRDLGVLGGSLTDRVIEPRGGKIVAGDEGNSSVTGEFAVCGGYALRELLRSFGNTTPMAGWRIEPGEVFTKLFGAGLISSKTDVKNNDLVFFFTPDGVIHHAAIVESTSSGTVVRNKDETSAVFTAPLNAAFFTDAVWKQAHGVPSIYRFTEPDILMITDTSKSGYKNKPGDVYLQNVKVVVKVPQIPDNARSILITADGAGILPNEQNKLFRKGIPIASKVEQELILPLGYKKVTVEIKDSSASDAENFGSGTTLASLDGKIELKDEHFFKPILMTYSFEPQKTTVSPPTLRGKLYLGAAPYQQTDKMNHGLFEIEAATGKSRQLTYRATDGVAVSPDGSMVASGMLSETGSGPGDPQLAFYNLKDNNNSIPSVFTLRPDDNGPKQLTGPAWSPDGKLLVISDVGDLRLYDPARKSGSRKIVSGWDSAWSPNDNRLVVAGNSGLQIVDNVLDMEDPWYQSKTQLVGNTFLGSVTTLQGTPTDANRPEWSPDGKNIAFISAKGVWVISASGGAPKRLTPDGWKTSAPVYSPDGRYVAFVRMEAEPDGGVWVMDAADGGNPRQIVKTNLSNIWRIDLDWAFAPGDRTPMTTTTSSSRTTTTTTTATPARTTTPTQVPSATPPVVRNRINGFRLVLTRLGSGDKPGTTSYEIDAVVTATVQDQPAVTATVITSVNSVPVSSTIRYPGETVTIMLQRADLTPGQVVQATCSLSPNGNMMTASVTVPQ